MEFVDCILVLFNMLLFIFHTAKVTTGASCDLGSLFVVLFLVEEKDSSNIGNMYLFQRNIESGCFSVFDVKSHR